MNLYLATVLHVVSSFTLSTPLIPVPGVANQMTYIEAGAPTVCTFGSVSWDGAAWHAVVSGCKSDRVFRSEFE